MRQFPLLLLVCVSYATEQVKEPSCLANGSDEMCASEGVLNDDDVSLLQTSVKVKSTKASSLQADFMTYGAPENLQQIYEDGVGAWTKVYQIADYGEFEMTSEAVGDIGEAGVTHNAKLSDADINALAKPLDGYSHVYRLSSATTSGDVWESSGHSTRKGQQVYVRSNHPYMDKARSFNVGGSTRKAGGMDGWGEDAFLGRAETYVTVADWIKMTYRGINYCFEWPVGCDQACDRFHVFEAPGDLKRCVKGGGSCDVDDPSKYFPHPSMPVLKDFALWLYTGGGRGSFSTTQLFCRSESIAGQCPSGTALTQQECQNIGDGEDGLYSTWGGAGNWDLPETCGCYIDQDGKRYFNTNGGACNLPEQKAKEYMICHAKGNTCPPVESSGKCELALTQQECQNLGDDVTYSTWGDVGNWDLPETCGCYIDQDTKAVLQYA